MTLANLVNFHLEINQLKNTIRYSTCLKSVQESTADHSWKLAILAIDVIDKLKLKINPLYSVKLALTHDISEYLQDHDIDSIIIANGQKSRESKRTIEEKVMRELTTKYNRQDIYDIWEDYENSKTEEAKFIKALDKIESIIHITDRGDRGRENDEDHTALYADKAVKAFPELIPLLREVKSRLKVVYREQGSEWKPEYDEV